MDAEIFDPLGCLTIYLKNSDGKITHIMKHDSISFIMNVIKYYSRGFEDDSNLESMVTEKIKKLDFIYDPEYYDEI